MRDIMAGSRGKKGLFGDMTDAHHQLPLENLDGIQSLEQTPSIRSLSI